MIEAGKLQHRITIKQTTKRPNAVGQVIKDAVVDLATVWAAKWQLSTKDITRQAGQTEQAEGKFLIRYRDDIRTGMLIAFDGRTYEITGTEETEDRTGLYLLVRSVNG